MKFANCVECLNQWRYTVSEHYLSSIPYFENPSTIPQKKQLMFFPINSSSIDRRENQYLVQIHADMMKVKKTDCPPPAHMVFRRATVTGFSPKSRKRMIEVCASVCDAPDLFATLTFADDTYAQETFDPKYFFELLRHWLQYHYPDIVIVWKLEAEPRKSGEFKGDFVPHYHLLIWLPKHQEIDRISLLKNKGEVWRTYWHKITESTSKDHLRSYGLQLEEIKSRRHGYHYVSKYAAKVNNDKLELGRRWGIVGEVDTLPVFEIEMSSKQFIELRRLIISYEKRIKKSYAAKLSQQTIKVGFTIFGLGAWDETNKGLDTSLIWQIIGLAFELANRNAKRNRNPKRTHQKKLVAMKSISE